MARASLCSWMTGRTRRCTTSGSRSPMPTATERQVDPVRMKLHRNRHCCPRVVAEGESRVTGNWWHQRRCGAAHGLRWGARRRWAARRRCTSSNARGCPWTYWPKFGTPWTSRAEASSTGRNSAGPLALWRAHRRALRSVRRMIAAAACLRLECAAWSQRRTARRSEILQSRPPGCVSLA